MPSTPASTARRASSGWQMPFSTNGQRRQRAEPGQVIPCHLEPKVADHCGTAALGSAPPMSVVALDLKTGSLM